MLFICGCVGFDKARESRMGYQKCVAEHGRDSKRCEELRAKAENDFRRYEEAAEKTWGCENSAEGCSSHGPATDKYGRPQR
jgi:hypothetical protein